MFTAFRVALLSFSSSGSDATATPSAVAATTTTPTPTILASAFVAAAAIATSVTVPTPTIVTTATVTPAVVAASTTIPTPTVNTSGNATATPSAVAVATTIPTPAVTAAATATPSVVALAFTIPSPTITTTGNSTVTPSVLAVTVVIPAATVDNGTAVPLSWPLDTYRSPTVDTYREGRMARSVTYTYDLGDEDPTIPKRWLDSDGTPVDLSSATFTLTVTNMAGTVVLTKTSGITGYNASPTDTTDPNMVIEWDTGELATIATLGRYTLRVTAVISGRARTFKPQTPDVLILN